MADQVVRFISGEISKCHLKNPREFTGKNGDSWKNYSVFINGAYEDTRDLVESYFNSGYPVRVFQNNSDEPVDPSVTDGVKFLGRIMVAQKETQNGMRSYLQAVSVDRIIGADDSGPEQEKGNPFKQNPVYNN